TRRPNPPESPVIPTPSCVACGRFSFRGTLTKHFGKKCFRVDAVRSVVRASVDAAWLLQMCAKIAGSGFLLDDRFLASIVFRIVGHHFERMQIDIAVGAVARAQAAADAPVLNDHLEGIAAANRADWAPHHA